MCANGEDDEIAYIQWGEDFGGPFSGGLDCGEYIELSKKTREEKSQDLHHLALRKLFECEQVGAFFWETSKAYGYGDESGTGESFTDDSHGAYGSWANINLHKPSSADIETILSAVIDMLTAMPFANQLSHGWTKEGNEAAEYLLPGDTVMVSSDWGADHVAFKVTTVDGRQIGYLDHWYVTQVQCSQETAARIIALALPYAKATVYELNPLSLRNAGVKEPEMSIRFDALQINLGEVRNEVRSALRKKASQRTLSTVAEEAM